MPESSLNSNVRSEAASKLLEQARQAKPDDATDLLEADHDEAKELFEQFFDSESSTEKQLLVAKLCLALSVHMRIEEDIFYPAVNSALTSQKDEDDRKEDSLVIPEARVEHASLKKLITEVESAPGDVERDARMQVMCEYTRHHIKEEEGKMFSKAKKCDVDMEELGEQIARRKLELLEEMAGEASSQPPSSLFRGETARLDSGARL